MNPEASALFERAMTCVEIGAATTLYAEIDPPVLQARLLAAEREIARLRATIVDLELALAVQVAVAAPAEDE